jgi:hypothetical protein
MGLFEPSPREAWRQFATEIGGEFVKGDGWLRRQFSGKGDAVLIDVKRWKIMLHTYSVANLMGGYTNLSTTYTCMRATFVNRGGLQFEFYREGLRSKLGKALGVTQDTQISDTDFDRKFIIKGNDEFKVRELLANPRVRQLIGLQLKDDCRFGTELGEEDCDVLYFEEEGVVKDAERLRSLVDLFAETLSQMCEIGIASEEDPFVDS